MASALSVFRALADPTRLRIVSILRDGPCCVGDIVDVLQVPQPKASRHLAHLRRAGLVQVRRIGSWAIYSLDDGVARSGALAAIDADRSRDETLRSDLERARRTLASGGACPYVQGDATREIVA